MDEQNSKESGSIMESLTNLLHGGPVDWIEQDCEIFSFDTDRNFIPITKQTVTYIVGGLVFNDDGQILMIQEAKSSCYGQWYLPAGRLEPGESFEEGVKREVEEEAGLIIEPTGLLCVEVAHSSFWYRLFFFAKVVGGQLKSYDQRDEESLQAKWFNIEDIQRKNFPLRANDVLRIIYLAHKQRTSLTRPADLLPVLQSHRDLIIRIVVVDVSVASTQLFVLMRRSTAQNSSAQQQQQQNEWKLPCVRLGNQGSSFTQAVAKLLQAAVTISSQEESSPSTNIPEPTYHGLLSIEHSATPASNDVDISGKEKPKSRKSETGKASAIHDGMCITILMSLNAPKVPLSPECIDTKSTLIAKAGYWFIGIGNAQLVMDLKAKIFDNFIVPLVFL